MRGAAEAIAHLDAALARSGEDIQLQRLTLGPGGSQVAFSADCRASVRGMEPIQLVEGQSQQRSRVIISPTDLDRRGWPGPASMPEGQPPSSEDRRIPIDGDRCIIAGAPRRVEAAVGIRMAGVLVRVELTVLG